MRSHPASFADDTDRFQHLLRATRLTDHIVQLQLRQGPLARLPISLPDLYTPMNATSVGIQEYTIASPLPF